MTDAIQAGSPFVTIVTVSLNAAQTIRDTLDSVAVQNAPFAIEHLCIDGGSTDGTRELINEFAARPGSRVRRIYEPDRGLFDAMNKGLQASLGEYVLFLNADDFLAGADSLAAAFRGVQTGPALPDMVMGDVIMGQPGHFGLWRYRRVPRWLPRLPRLGAHPPHQGNFIRRSLLLQAEGFDLQQRLAADTTQFYKLVFQYGPRLHVAGSVVSFMRSGGASNAHLGSYKRGNLETYRFLRQYRQPLHCMTAVFVKMAFKIFEYRVGRLEREASWIFGTNT